MHLPGAAPWSTDGEDKVLVAFASLLAAPSLARESKAPAGASFSERVRRVVVAQLGVRPVEVRDHARFVEDLGADSLDEVELIMAFEEEFEIEIPDRDAERLHTVGQVIGYLQRRLAAQTPR